MKKPPKNLEIIIQRELLKWLHVQGLEVVWIRNEGKKSMRSAVLDKKSGLVAGFPDLIIFKQIRSITHILHLELKTKDGVLNKNQIKWHGEFVPSGNRKLATAYGLVQAQEIVTNWLASITAKQTPS